MPDIETGPETVGRVLSAYDLGSKLRRLRLRKKIALAELGRHTGLSASMLSQLETGKLVPTLPTLARIAMVFDVGLDYFFGTRRKAGLFELVRKGERMQFPSELGIRRPAFLFEVLAYKATNKQMEAYLAEFPRREKREAATHTHAGAELLFVMEGRLEVAYQDDIYILEAGDAAYFDAAEPHSYRGLSRAAAKALVVAAPSAR
ncbi:MAG TPA: cupin domain-containing protein [Bryobacteraceae bacterium]|nr:cupin domain-containing protein [Bryobacteraceae bacterium]